MNTEKSSDPSYPFYGNLARVLNSGQSRCVMLAGQVHDLFYAPAEERYQPLLSYLCEKCSVEGVLLMIYELNGPIRLHEPKHESEAWERLRQAWVAWRAGTGFEDLVWQSLTDRKRQRQREELEAEFDRRILQAVGKPTLALEFMRQLTLCSRAQKPSGAPYLKENLLIFVEGTDLLLPAGDGEVSRLSASDRHRVHIVSDWLSDPGFLESGDALVLLADSRSLVHPRVSKLPQVMAVEVDPPDLATRTHFLQHYLSQQEEGVQKEYRPKIAALARMSAGLSIHALRQLLIGAVHSGSSLEAAEVIPFVEEYIRSCLGEDVVEFKKPQHSLDDVVGFSRLKEFVRQELLPRFKATGDAALPGAAVAGPIGGGKTFVFEAVAAALDLPVLVLKNIRSQWFGQTDVIFERLRGLLEALDKVIIFVDEADTQFGGIGAQTHSTERRLTGKIQQMMSDPRLRGRVVWLLMTARIQLLSPDIRRPGRVGDLIIPVLDPEGDDRREFLSWVLDSAIPLKDSAGTPAEQGGGSMTTEREQRLDRLDELTPSYSAAAFAGLRSQLRAAKARLEVDTLPWEEVERIVADSIPPAINETRRYQTLQALLNCTRRSLLPDPTIGEEERERWHLEIRALESRGIQ